MLRDEGMEDAIDKEAQSRNDVAVVMLCQEQYSTLSGAQQASKVISKLVNTAPLQQADEVPSCAQAYLCSLLQYAIVDPIGGCEHALAEAETFLTLKAELLGLQGEINATWHNLGSPVLQALSGKSAKLLVCCIVCGPRAASMHIRCGDAIWQAGPHTQRWQECSTNDRATDMDDASAINVANIVRYQDRHGPTCSNFKFPHRVEFTWSPRNSPARQIKMCED